MRLSCFLFYRQLTSVQTPTDPGTCQNIITGMNIQIVYANVGAINNPQPQIIGAEYQFICQPMLRFQVICITHEYLLPLNGRACGTDCWSKVSLLYSVVSLVSLMLFTRGQHSLVNI